MKIKLLILILTSVLFFSYSFLPISKKCTVLVIKDRFGSEKFSLFSVEELNGVLIGINQDSDYPVNDGLYFITSTSNDNYYHKKILIQNIN